MISMTQLFRMLDSESLQRAGYEARYFADITFMKPSESCGMIHVTLGPKSASSPHRHMHLEEVFMALTEIRIHVDDASYDLNRGDVILVSPGEMHSFEVLGDNHAQILAMKFPNIKDDKISD